MMYKTKIKLLILIAIYLNLTSLFAVEESNILKKLLLALDRNSVIIESKKDYEFALISEKYHHLEWWSPSLTLSNDLIYPHKNEFYNDLATSNATSAILALPFSTGTVLNLSAKYTLNRGLVESLHWGLSQDLEGVVGISQSLNPWWIHTRDNPYTLKTKMKTAIAKCNYDSKVKISLLSCVQTYIDLRKAERNRDIILKKIALYNEKLILFKQLHANGSISLRDILEIKEYIWDFEQQLFSTENRMIALKGELYQATGISVESCSDETLIAFSSSIWEILMGETQFESASKLEEKIIHAQREILKSDRLISKQSNALLLNFNIGSSYKLPLQEIDALEKSWEREHFEDNPFNNWVMTLSIDFSSLLSALNKKNDLEYEQSQIILEELLENTYINMENEIIKNNARINQLEDHITYLTESIDRDRISIQENLEMFNKGVLNEVDYNKSLVEFQSKNTLLENFNDDLWLYNFLEIFYYN